MAPARLLPIALGLIACIALLVWFFARPQPERQPASPDRGPPGEGTALAVPQEEEASPEPGEAADTDEPPTEEPPPDETRREARTARAPAVAPQGIRGRLLGPGDQPLAGARVLAAASDPRWPWPLDARLHPASARRPPAETKSDADGRFVLLGLEPGPLRVALRRAGSADMDLDELWLQARTVLDLGDLRLEPGLQLEGRIAGLDAGELGTPVEIVRL
ncbi:MAG TPA: carboxypeptidase-like regulatory domain-containing protein, partial [Planctomycetota bacterium]|nr:carboxypeptidase-like regulatory domain-containing protein [Planctomycetota bacterium]